MEIRAVQTCCGDSAFVTYSQAWLSNYGRIPGSVQKPSLLGEIGRHAGQASDVLKEGVPINV